MREFTLLKIYLVIISIVGLIGCVSGYGTLVYQTIKYKVITADEYLVGSYNNYELTQCDNPIAVTAGTATTAPTKETTTATRNRTPEEITKCKADAKKTILARRDFEYKDGVLSSSIWGTVFLILFLTHFPVFFKIYREDRNK